MDILIVLAVVALLGAVLVWRRHVQQLAARTAYLDCIGAGPEDLPRLLVPDPGRERWN